MGRTRNIEKSLDKLILGWNPLLGVYHFLPEKAREKAPLLSIERCINVIFAAVSSGARGFNFGVEPKAYQILASLKELDLGCQVGLYPIIPNVQSLVSVQLRKGTMGMLIDTLKALSWSNKSLSLLRIGISAIATDPKRAVKAYLDAEVEKLLKSSSTHKKLKCILLHEVATDLAVCYDAVNLIMHYIKYLREKKIYPGFVTRNFVRFVDFCEKNDIPLKEIIIMTPFNKLGFQMTPSRDECERALTRVPRSNVIAISILAGGRLPLEEGFEYVKSLGIGAVAVGVSTESQAKDTFTHLSNAFRNEGM
jgi:hypothetical protein